MSGRPWLEALKATMREQGTDTEKPLEKILEALPSEGCERCESLADRPTPIVDLQTTEKVRGSWGEEERRLTAAGWKPKERCGKTIYQSPKRGFWYSQKIALHLSESGSVSS
jgi:hypothetical protein